MTPRPPVVASPPNSPEEQPARTGPALRGVAVATAVAAVLLALAPWPDLAVATALYRGDGRFIGTHQPLVDALHDGINLLAVPVLAIAVICGIAAYLRSVPFLGFTPRRSIYVVLVVALGPGLLVNGILKEWWGRARPAQIEAFGGTRTFSPAWIPADQCAGNCSFVSGDVSVAASMLALALLAPVPWRRRAVQASVALTVAIALARMSVGAHFFSDTLFAALLTTLVALALHRLILETPARLVADRSGFGAGHH